MGISVTEAAIDRIVESYTRESGVRNLERTIASTCRELAVRKAEGKNIQDVEIDEAHVEEVLGPQQFEPEIAEAYLAPGITVGLGVGGGGGELLLVEVSKMAGKGKVHVTGSLGPVLEEAAHTAVSFVRSRATRLHLEDDWIEKIDLHVHIPRARAARDFAGMGGAIFGAVCSLLLDAPCRPDVAVVGELTLRGTVLPVKGVKAMLFCAHRAGVKEVLLPARNEPDVCEVPDEVLADLRIRYIHRLDEVLPLLLAPSQPGGSDSSGALSPDAHP
jgi:ATP-dependent Lon protease